ncbi:uncharacterized protein LOC126686242 [Mercurialis annua]|uniref:uncharacterized protein LOC126686242 n=1 Tax=Mercurialis annua TaxID=3986 RepID=UPI00215E667F|nr:uncharacterized protein LOC126686242 [Mercurialis annua]
MDGEAMDTNCPRKLDFNLPLLSTRRLGGSPRTSSVILSQHSRNGIPFCWEQTPGKPKNTEQNDVHDGDTPRPRLPPCRWEPPEKKGATINNDDVYNHCRDGSCDADIDDSNDEDAYDMFSDAVEVLSLTEAIDIVQKAEDDEHSGLDRLNLERMNSSDHSDLSNYMIERFLPDATALAASSVLYSSNNNTNYKFPYLCKDYVEEYVSQTVGRSYSSKSMKKGCGLEILFPWRIKHKLCGVKSPVRQVSPNVQSICITTAKQQKHHSNRRDSTNVSKIKKDI